MKKPKSELHVTKNLIEVLRHSDNPESIELWDKLNGEPLELCPKKYEKKAGAKADACFLNPSDTCLLIENKCYEADLTDRQKLLYANHFMHFYDNCDLTFAKHKLVFVTQENSGHYDELKELFSRNYKFPFDKLEKSHLKKLRMLSSGVEQGDGSVSYWVEATYKKLPTPFTINVLVVGVDLARFEAERVA